MRRGLRKHEVLLRSSFLNEMFCANCGRESDGNAGFCSKCGHELKTTIEKPFGRPGTTIKSFVGFKTSLGRPTKSQLNNTKGKGKNKKEEGKEVIISIGLMFWDGAEGKLKEKRGKKMALRVDKDDCYMALLEKAQAKWKSFHSNLYQANSEYVLLLEDGKEAIFLPGTSCKEFFSLSKYKEEIMKDYKRITLFLCTEEDFKSSTTYHSDDEGDHNTEEPNITNSSSSPPTKKKNAGCSSATADSPPTKKKNAGCSSATADSPPTKKKNAGCSNATADDRGSWFVLDGLDRICNQVRNSEEPNIVNGSSSPATEKTNAGCSSATADDRGSWFVLDELDRIYNQVENIDNPPSSCQPDSAASIVKILEERVVADGKISLFIVIRRGVSVRRAISLWQRATTKVDPIHVVRVKFIGEDGIDDGALAREFFSSVIPSIGETFFPDGTPVYSTNDLYNYKAIGQLISASLSQGGPAPNFVSPCVYETLTSNDIAFNNQDLHKNLTEKEEALVEDIKSNVSLHQDTIIEHGYTGPIDDSNLENITKAVMASIISRRAVMLKELKNGMGLFGLDELISKHPELCKSLFVAGEQEVVDADYLFSLMKPEFSPEGSSRRLIEDAVMDHFQDFIFSLEDQETTSGYAEALAWKSHPGISMDDDDNNESDDAIVKFNEADLSPAAVMGWLTGQRHRDLTTKSVIYVRFDHDCLKRNPKHSICFPCVGACGRVITLPVTHMSTSEAFKDNFLIAFCKGQAFSLS